MLINDGTLAPTTGKSFTSVVPNCSLPIEKSWTAWMPRSHASGHLEQPTGSFGRSVKRLSKPMKQELATVMDELLSGTLSPGRRYEKLKLGENLHSVRMSRRYRFVFSDLEHGHTPNRLQSAPHGRSVPPSKVLGHIGLVTRNRKSLLVQFRGRSSGVSGSSLWRRSKHVDAVAGERGGVRERQVDAHLLQARPAGRRPAPRIQCRRAPRCTGWSASEPSSQSANLGRRSPAECAATPTSSRRPDPPSSSPGFSPRVPLALGGTALRGPDAGVLRPHRALGAPHGEPIHLPRSPRSR